MSCVADRQPGVTIVADGKIAAPFGKSTYTPCGLLRRWIPWVAVWLPA